MPRADERRSSQAQHPNPNPNPTLTLTRRVGRTSLWAVSRWRCPPTATRHRRRGSIYLPYPNYLPTLLQYHITHYHLTLPYYLYYLTTLLPYYLTTSLPHYLTTSTPSLLSDFLTF